MAGFAAHGEAGSSGLRHRQGTIRVRAASVRALPLARSAHACPRCTPTSTTRETAANPLDLVEKLAVANDWPFHRQTDEELAAEIAGQWCHYKLWFAWHPELGVMHLSCALDMKVPAKKRTPVYALLAMANEKLWLGHFDLWSEEGLPVFRHAVLFREGIGASSELIEDLVDIAVSECERFYPAFQFVIWGGKDPAEAITAALLETEGEA